MAGQTIEITDANFTTEVLQSDIPVLVDFWAEWCSPCRAIAPLIEKISQDYQGKLKVGKLNVDDYSDLASKYGITAIPTLIVFKDGKPIDRIVGVISEEELKSRLNSLFE